MAVQVSLPSSQSPPRSPPRSQATNTVTVTALPKSFFDPLILNLLREHFASYGEINQWVPLPGFGRVIVVFEEDHSAEMAKQHSDPILLQATSDQYVFSDSTLRLNGNLIACLTALKSLCEYFEQTGTPLYLKEHGASSRRRTTSNHQQWRRTS